MNHTPKNASGTSESATAGRRGELLIGDDVLVARLGLGAIPKGPDGDQLGALKDLQAEGKIKHIGLSEVIVRQLQNARTIVPIVSVQNRYSVTDRASEDVLEYCEQHDIVFIPWFPLAAGQLSGADSPIRLVAAQKNVTPSQVALAWLLARSPVILPIPGTSKVAHLVENVEAARVGLTEGDIDAINSAGGT